MKREVRKLERYSKEVRLVVREKLKTTEDVKSYIVQTKKEIENVSKVRQGYRNKLRNCKDEEKIKDYKNRRNECTAVLDKYRKNLKIANYILYTQVYPPPYDTLLINGINHNIFLSLIVK